MSRPRVCLFIGPSVRPGDVEAWSADVCAEVVVLAPVQQGDLLRVAELAPTHVCIVDGAFFQVPSVSHKEILLTLERGVRVLGAASLGALRAAELDQFGMEGVGAIYRLYKSGAIDGDDEVAVLHAEAADRYAPLTDPLVSIRHNLRRARARRLITPATAAAVLASARALHFTHRTYAAVLAAAAHRVAPDELTALRQFLQHDVVDLKRADALALLSLLKRRLAGKNPWPVSPVVRTHRTVYAHLFAREYQGRSRGGLYVTDAFVLSLYKLLAPSAARTRRRVALRSLAVDEARRGGLRPCLKMAPAQDWLDERCLSAEEGHAALCERDLEQQVLSACAPGPAYRRLVAATAARVGVSPLVLLSAPRMQPGIPWDGPLLREVKLSGAFRATFEYACRVQEFAADMAQRMPGLTESLALARLESWAVSKWGINGGSFGRALVLRGFASYREFVDVARPAYLYEWLGSAERARALNYAALAQ
jgi:hypothetical protein